MNKKVLTLSAVMASMLFGAAAHAADTRIGVTIYKYDDNFMSVVRKAIEKDGKSAPDVQLLMNDSQNDQSKQNDQIDVLLAKGVKALAINLVDPAAAPANHSPTFLLDEAALANGMAAMLQVTNDFLEDGTR